ncbi:hypothetical protein Gocc_0616 [Gaiella occulta]|uniref:Uncharacterized protein n=1 Tax=Gaiella occulta TaxID=1002870 RepID=A0A7M2Z1H7_9ACTN|nr:hypothetical protein [Gaiella occulta]RDI76197.1 hypothetical protein Gocc_0616 [Gaiella occulta]
MTATLAAGLVLAFASAAALNWGYLAQHGETARLPPLSLRRPLLSLRSLFTSLRWLAGFLAGIGGWVLYVAALALAPLSLVQAASAGGIGLLALLVWKTTATPLARREWAGVGVATAGLALLGVSLAGERKSGGHGSWLVVAAWMALSLAAAALAASPATRRLAAGAGLGIAAGVLYAAGDVGTKAAVAGGPWLLFVPALLACHGLAFVALQLGFQRGGALATAGVATLFTNALPILAGLIVYHEPLPAGLLGALRLLSFAAVIAGAAVLARGGSTPGETAPGIRAAQQSMLGVLRGELGSPPA